LEQVEMEAFVQLFTVATIEQYWGWETSR
jgi:hypothetical protein